MAIAPTYALNDGTQLPAIGFGTSPMDDAETETAVREAVRLGYRLVDTASRYGNEAGVGRAVATVDVPRSEILITSKLPRRRPGVRAGAEGVRGDAVAVGRRVRRPLPDPLAAAATRQVRETVAGDDQAARRRAGPLDRGQQLHARRISTAWSTRPAWRPAVNQIELHPYFPQPEMRAADAERGVADPGWRPLGRGGELLAAPPIADAAARHGRTPAQVVLRWHVQLGAVPIPKSATPERKART